MEEKKIAICSHGKTNTFLSSLLAMSAMVEIPYINDDILFPKFKPVRNVPQYMPKKEQGRNELCNCRSGLKYKKCCGR